MSVAVKRIDIENKIFKVVVFHTHKSSELFEFHTPEQANEFYKQMIKNSNQENNNQENNNQENNNSLEEYDQNH